MKTNQKFYNALMVVVIVLGLGVSSCVKPTSEELCPYCRDQNGIGNHDANVDVSSTDLQNGTLGDDANVKSDIQSGTIGQDAHVSNGNVSSKAGVQNGTIGNDASVKAGKSNLQSGAISHDVSVKLNLQSGTLGNDASVNGGLPK